ncbi:ATP-binding cassette domain-containing protein [Planctomycetota bacterium]
MKYAVETINLTKIFSDWWGRNKVYAVNDLNLQISYNEVYGLLGPNGSGKTTTLKMLLGLLYPTKGKAIALGGDSSNPKISARIGFMPEESYLYRYLNARETLDFYGRLFKLPARVRKMRTEALLDMVGLKAVANRPVGTFSKGMARRIGLAQALINDPELLILDEPTTGLDPIGTRQIKDLVLKLSERGKTVLLCSHLLADVEDVCDRISILYGGSIQTEGEVRELLRQTDKKQITTGNISDNTIEKIKQLIQNENADCEITSPMDKLETFFVKTVAAAQRKAQPTSGAVSDSKATVADFLASQTDEKGRREAILDKLLSPVSPEVRPETPKTQTPVPPEEPERKTDEELLTHLTKPADAETSKPIVSKPEKDEKEPREPPLRGENESKEDVLEQLTNQQPNDEKSDEQRDKPLGN